MSCRNLLASITLIVLLAACSEEKIPSPRVQLVCRPTQNVAAEMAQQDVRHGTKSTLATINECSVLPALKESAARNATLEDAANQGSAEAMVRLGMEEMEHNEERAVAWFCQAARQSHPEAQLTLGKIYQEKGLPLAAQSIYQPVRVKKDNAIAYAWYFSAARQNHGLAKTYLALLKRSMNNTQMEQAETLALDPRAIPCQYQGQTL